MTRSHIQPLPPADRVLNDAAERKIERNTVTAQGGDVHMKESSRVIALPKQVHQQFILHFRPPNFRYL